ncbi:Uncharacterised protein [uncultured archaeon]|nr:Uncharacterised protein [uncultured archaeon]
MKGRYFKKMVDEEHVKALVDNSRVSELAVMTCIRELAEKEELSDSLKVQLVGKMIAMHKIMHGSYTQY